ncbi:helix-turn-helix domain-containing protein, partial [Escherichia coli]
KRAYCLKTQPATGETYPKSDLFNKANQMTTEDILEKLKISLKTFYCHKHNIMMILNLKRINELVRHQHIDYLV